MAHKADMEKAFDQMEWDLLVLALENFGFPPIFIKCIYSCLSSASFSILLNGSGFGIFHASHFVKEIHSPHSSSSLAQKFYLGCYFRTKTEVISKVLDLAL